jgi:hypothetical protein
MERELWLLLYSLVQRLDKQVPKGLFSTAEILGVYFWAVVHDRPISWAVTAENWPADLWPACLPSQSTMSRRLRKAPTSQLLTDVEDHLAAVVGVASYWIRVIDAKALPIGGCGHDPDARRGRGGQQGYKLHAVWGAGPLPAAWALTPMNLNEKTVARDLIPTLPGEGYLLADSQYDGNEMYELAAAAGYQLLVRKTKPTGGVGHRRHSPQRLRSIELLRTPFGEKLYRRRRSIEHNFGSLTCFGGGLGPLPAWVRRFPRVVMWVRTKLLLNAVRILRKQSPEMLAVA